MKIIFSGSVLMSLNGFKKVSQVLLLLTCGAVSGQAFSKYRDLNLENKATLDGFALTEEKGLSSSPRKVSKAILSYKGEPLCVADTVQYPSLVPAFWQNLSSPQRAQNVPRESLPDLSPLTLAECGGEEMNRIYQGAQNASLVDEESQGVEVAAPFLPYVAMCAGGFLLGAGLVITKELDERLFGMGMSFLGGSLSLGMLIVEVSESSPGQFRLVKGLGVIGACAVGGAYSVHYATSAE